MTFNNNEIQDEDDAGAFHLVQFLCALPFIVSIIVGSILAIMLWGMMR